MELHFTNNWFGNCAQGVWEQLIPQIKPARILEVGSYEGASACWLIRNLGSEQVLEIHCVDTWEGGIEHQLAGIGMADVEARFDHNIATVNAAAAHPAQVTKLKDRSDHALAKLLADGMAGHFDFVYIDGSHQAPDVLCDAVLGFRLLKVGGVLAFDDYIWREHVPAQSDLLRCPKPAIDAFVNLYFRKLDIFRAPLYQLYLRKEAD